MKEGRTDGQVNPGLCSKEMRAQAGAMRVPLGEKGTERQCPLGTQKGLQDKGCTTERRGNWGEWVESRQDVGQSAGIMENPGGMGPDKVTTFEMLQEVTEPLPTCVPLSQNDSCPGAVSYTHLTLPTTT